MIDTFTTRMVRAECCSCHCLFGMSEELEEQKRNDGDWFYCPNGHKQHYAESNLVKVKKQLKWAEERTAREITRHDQTKAELKSTEHSRRAEKGAKTRIKNRIKNGVCPCCNRTFANLHRHMESQHPTFVEEKT